jgi:YVTN family beta-propeller protein
MHYFRHARCLLRLLILGGLAGMGSADAAPFAYISNNNRNTVSVIDTAVNAVVATVPVGTQPYGGSVNPAGTFVYVTNHGSNNVSVIELVKSVLIFGHRILPRVLLNTRYITHGSAWTKHTRPRWMTYNSH